MTANIAAPVLGRPPLEVSSVRTIAADACDECAPRHFFPVDVEEYVPVSACDATVRREDWTRMPSRVEASTETMLELLARHGARGTFFVLGWVAARQPALVRRIADAGHEVASHGWSHRRACTLTPSQFRAEARASRLTLEDAAGARVLGYRAPSFSVLPGWEWCLDVLLEEGYRYDSSLFPIRRRGYGYPGAPHSPTPLRRATGTLWEFPLATLRLGGLRLPAAGGGYLRHFPFAAVRAAFRQHAEARTPGVFYVHPWEIDPQQPRLPAPWLTRVRHYRGLSGTLGRLGRLLDEFCFSSIGEWLAPRLGTDVHETRTSRADEPVRTETA